VFRRLEEWECWFMLSLLGVGIIIGFILIIAFL